MKQIPSRVAYQACFINDKAGVRWGVRRAQTIQGRQSMTEQGIF